MTHNNAAGLRTSRSKTAKKTALPQARSAAASHSRALSQNRKGGSASATCRREQVVLHHDPPPHPPLPPAPGHPPARPPARPAYFLPCPLCVHLLFRPPFQNRNPFFFLAKSIWKHSINSIDYASHPRAKEQTLKTCQT